MKYLNQKHIYVLIKRNELSGTSIEDGSKHTEKAIFSTERLLVGNFSVAEDALRLVAKKITRQDSWWYKPPLKVVMHPLEMNEGGLSEVEYRAVRELGLSAFLKDNVRSVVVWNGKDLSEEEIRSCE
ncbi:MAG: hypothetical protein RPT25_11755 [Cycloclasticus sp.]|jgi:hypothetical protein